MGQPGQQPDVRARRATSFGPVAELYERSRPGYPAAAVADLLGEPPLDVIDLGAGTGKLTRTLVAAGHRVTAVDPSAQMLEVLAREVPEVTCVVASAESVPMPDHAADAVVAAQAYHWFDPERALPEIARLLRPGGTLGLFWNVRDDRQEWVAEFGDLVGNEDAGDALEPPDLGTGFRAPQVRVYDHAMGTTPEGLAQLAASRSAIVILPPAERAERLEKVRLLGVRTAAGGPLAMPYRLQVWSAGVLKDG